MLENLRNKMYETMQGQIKKLTEDLQTEKNARISKVEDINEFEF